VTERRRSGRPVAAALVGLALLSAPVPSTPAAAQQETMGQGVFFPETFTLSNGMQVVAVVNRRVPVVAHMLMYKVGAADEPRGKSGIAHYLEHLMFKGTETRAPGEFSRIVARNGGRDNAFTSWDYTGYYQTIAADRLETVMRMEADRMANLRLTDEVTAPELQVVLEERRQTVSSSPARRLGEEVSAALFVHHPYGTPIIGWQDEVAGLTREDAEAFYRQWYAPNNAVLLVSGDVDLERFRALAEEVYGRIPARPVPTRTRVAEPRLETARRVVLRDAEVRQPAFQRYFLAPSYSRGATEHAYPLQVLAEIMGGETGRLYQSLAVEQKVATSASMSYGADVFDLSSVGVYASPAPSATVEQVEAAVEAELLKLLKDGVTVAEVERAKRRLRFEAVYARDSVFGPARTLGTALATGQSVEDVEEWPSRIAAVTVEQVNAAARAVLGTSGHVTGLLLPVAGDRAEAVR